ncbi:MAG TPA: hypothetical protein VFT13_00255 [Candidatus Krumholzibacteria bacterium]|nr:hypothetical protein [Candidatus Krumholzibacteria bacterium]
MQRSTLLAVSVLVFAAHASGVRAQAYAPPADTTAPQTFVPRLTNFSSLATIMNLARGTVRIVAVVSPSSDGARGGMDVVASILRDIPSKRLRAYVILSHAGPADSEVRALDLAARHRDRRIVYLWDPEAVVATALAPVVGLAGKPAHDVCLLYDTDATFSATLATPALWMQLRPGSEGPALDAASLHARANDLVGAVEQKAAGAAAKP